MATERLTATRPTTDGRGRRLLYHAAIIAFGLLMLYPLLWMVSGSFKPIDEVFGSSLLPSRFELTNYIEGWDSFSVPFGVYFVNSTIIAVGAIVGNLLSCSLAAYVFARHDFRLKKSWFALMLLTTMVPYHAVMIPQYLLFSQLDWVNTVLPLIVPKFLATDAFFVFLMVQFIRSIPRDLDEAASIDGCGPFRIYWKIILPLMVPALATTAVFTFIWTWNDFLTPLIYLTDPEKYTVPLALATFQSKLGGTNWGPLLAMSTLSLVPVLIAFFVGQKYLVRGVSTTGLK